MAETELLRYRSTGSRDLLQWAGGCSSSGGVVGYSSDGRDHSIMCLVSYSSGPVVYVSKVSKTRRRTDGESVSAIHCSIICHAKIAIDSGIDIATGGLVYCILTLKLKRLCTFGITVLHYTLHFDLTIRQC